MANIHVEMGPRPQHQREEIIAELSEVMIKHGSPRDSTFVILTEVSTDLWGRGGVTYTKRIAEAKRLAEEAVAAETGEAAEQ